MNGLLSNTYMQHLIPMRLKLLHEFPGFHSSSGSFSGREWVVQSDAFVAGAG